MKRMLFCFILLFAVPLMAGDVTLIWDVVADPAVDGYKIYWGTASGVYGVTPAIVIGRLVNTYTVKGLPSGTWFFAATATAGASESGFSNEVSTTVKPPAPGNLTITIVTAAVGKKDATIKWTTNINSTGWVFFGDQPYVLSYGLRSLTEGTDHTVIINDLKPKHTYYFIVEASTSAGDKVTSDVNSFSTFGR